MQWSKTKAMLESFLCAKLKGRVHIHATVYRKFHDAPGRVWVTFDKEEIASASDVTHAVRHAELYEKLKAERKLKPIPRDPDWRAMDNSAERLALLSASDEAENRLVAQNIMASYHAYSALMQYGTLSIEEALQAEEVWTRAFSMFDWRLGKRRLEKLAIGEETHPMVAKFYNIRCRVEGLQR